jgi:2-dehydropantoate 2-reductase
LADRRLKDEMIANGGMARMRVAIVGAGAMGGLWASKLEQFGADVSVVDVSSAVVDAINTNGLSVTASDGEIRTHPKASTSPDDVGIMDIVYVFTKAHHTGSAAAIAARLSGPETTVVSLQNGWGNSDVIAPVVGPDRLVFGVTYHSARVDGPGIVAHTSPGPTVLGGYEDSSMARAEAVARLQSDSGLDTTAMVGVRTEIWKKVILNTATLPTAALTGLFAGEIGEGGEMLALVDAIAVESVGVVRGAGYDVDGDERVAFINELLGRAGRGKASMLQDVEGRRKTEVEVVNGAIVREAARLGLDAPLNKAMVALIGGLERSWGHA